MQHRYSKKTSESTKSKKKRRMPKALNQRIKEQIKGKNIFKTCPNQWDDLVDESCELINIELKKKKIAKKPIFNYIQSLNYGVPDHFIFTLYGMITVDQKALKQQSKDQSLITSIFNFYSLVKVQPHSNYLCLTIEKSQVNSYPIPYYIERFRNFGDAYFYDLSNKIAKLDSIMSQFKTIPFINEISEGQLDNYLQKMKGKAFLLRVTPNKLYFSKELIQISGCTIPQITNQCLKFRSFVAEFFNADNYREQIDNFFDIFDLRMQLLKEEIDSSEYIKQIIQKSVDYITNKDQGIIKVVTNKYNMAPSVGCWEIQQIIGKEELNLQKYQANSKNKHNFYQNKKWSELSKIKKLFPFFLGNDSLNKQNKMCSYKEIEVEA